MNVLQVVFIALLISLQISVAGATRHISLRNASKTRTNSSALAPDPTSGAWNHTDLQGRGGNGLNSVLAKLILDMMRSQHLTSVVDFGCGTGAYSWYLKQNGFSNVRCYDGNPATPSVSRGLCSEADLSLPVTGIPPAQLVFALEVGEHIPQAREATFLSNLQHTASNFLILSWALPGQPGVGHVNCQPNEYIVSRLQALGFVYDAHVTQTMRHQIDVSAWQPNSHNFVKTLMVFHK